MSERPESQSASQTASESQRVSPSDPACVILAGGKARRFGHRVKALIEIAGEPILDRILEVVTPRFADLAIAANDPAPYRERGLPILPDEVPDQGPLAGILSALRWSPRPHVMTVPCDMPFVDGRVIDHMLSCREPGVDAVALFIGGLPEPLFAIYSKQCLPAVEARLNAGRYKASGLLTDEGLAVCQVPESELRAIDPELTSLTNINRPDDLDRALRRLAGDVGDTTGDAGET